MVLTKPLHHLALATAMAALMAGGLSGCDCGEGSASSHPEVAQTLKEHPCGDVDGSQAPGYTPASSPEGHPTLVVAGAFVPGSRESWEVLDTNGQQVNSGVSPLVSSDNFRIEINLVTPLPPGKYQVHVTNGTGACAGTDIGKSLPFTVE